MADAHGPTSALGLARIRHATRHSLQGLGAVYRHEAAFRQELALAAVLTPAALALALWSPVTWTQCALLVASLLLVLLTELLNSALESVVDRVSEDPHPLSKRAKDAGSAAVLIALVLCGAVWSLVLLDAFAA